MLVELAERIDPDQPVELIIAGGAAMTSAGLRQMTADVDVVSDLPADVLAAATSVADDRDLSPRWLNANAISFLPSDAQAHVIVQHGPLTVRAVSANDLFVMKLDAARPRDVDDLRVLWKHCTYATAEEAVADFEERTPLAPAEHDPHLADWIRSIVDTS